MTISELARHGGFYCSQCKAFTGPTEETCGEAFQACCVCHARGTLRWHPPTLGSPESEPPPKREPMKSKN